LAQVSYLPLSFLEAGAAASMLSPEEFGVDEKATELLHTLPVDQQQVALSKLQAGIASGRVRNCSSFLVGVCNGPDVLGVDDEAAKMLAELPKDLQKDVLEKLRKYWKDVRNPSAWVIRAVLEKKSQIGSIGGGGGGFGGCGGSGLGGGGGGSFGGGGGGTGSKGAGPQNDQQMMTLIRALPKPARQQVLMMINNMQALNKPSAAASPSSSQQLDDEANALLRSLPMEKQHEIRTKLKNSLAQGQVQNASAWVAKACLRAGAILTSSGYGATRSSAKEGMRPSPF